jgi:hypothetical protein
MLRIKIKIFFFITKKDSQALRKIELSRISAIFEKN